MPSNQKQNKQRHFSVPSFIKLEYHIVLVGGRETLKKKYTIAQFIPKEDRSIKLNNKFSISGAYIAFKF